MRIDEYITNLRKVNQITIHVVDQVLKLKAPDHALTPQLIEEIKAKKAEILEFFSKANTGDKLSAIPAAAIKSSYVLSAAQKRMYFLYELDQSSVAYNMPQFIKLEGKVNVTRLAEALRNLVKRHESLRTVFRIEQDEPVQYILEESDFGMVHTLAEDADPILANFVKPFDLHTGPLLRAELISTSTGVHILAIDMPHIVTDGVSNVLLVRDFMQLYQGLKLDGLTIHYKDYAEWQQSEARQHVLAAQKEFWLTAYAEETNQLNLPSDFPRPQLKQHAGDTVKFTLDSIITAGLLRLSAEQGVTMYMILLSFYKILLGRLANTADVVVGSPVAGREHTDLEGIIGMFANTLPIRSYPDGAKTYQDYLAELKQISLQCFENQSYQYEELVNNLKIDRDTSRNPLFDVMFSYENFGDDSLELPGLTISPYQSNHYISKFDLTLSASQKAETLHLQFDYSTSLYNKERISRYVAYFQRIAAAVLEDVTVKISAINLLSKEEVKEQLVTFNTTAIDYPREKTLLDLFSAQVLRTPDHIAVVHGNSELSYQELEVRANQLANYLRSKGVSTGTHVAILVERSVEMIIGLLGILKAGAVYIPLNNNQPLSHQQQIIAESKSEFLLCSSAVTANYQQIKTLGIDDDLILEHSTADLNLSLSPEAIAYIIYTSGTTGKPNGVLVNHRSVVNLLTYQQQIFGIDSEESILQFATLSFDASVEQIWLALHTGTKLVLISTAVITDQAKWNAYLIHHKITHLHATPSFLEQMDLPMPNHIKRIIAGGEECSPHLANRFCEDYKFYNEYGPTETTVTAVEYEVKEKIALDSKVPIGRPVGNTKVYILGANKELLPKGVTGELYIGGEGLTQGYFNAEALTSARFIPNPYATGELIYKTGDLVRWMEDGNLVYVGRNDEQVKIRGFRIELGEIECQLLKHEDLQHAVVTVYTNGHEKYLAAYYVSPDVLTDYELRSFLGSKIPDYMIPASFIRLESIPLNANGKIDKKALPDPVMNLKEDYVAPANPTETQLVEIWSSLLQLEPALISVNKSFFELGGHSLKAVTMVNKIRSQMSVEVSLKQIFQMTSIQEISNYIANELWLKSTMDHTLNEEFILD